ncbi:MAG TPA: outer membrane beta-barrel protein [Hyphomicrobiales bacterium]|jgi:outer membrane immunogenic protein
MRKFAIGLAIASVIGAVNGAQAADLGDYRGSMKDSPYEAPAAIWSGLYVGGHLGGLWTNSGDNGLFKRHCKEFGYETCAKWDDWKEIKKVEFSEDDDDTSFIGGVHIGYNWQSGSTVYGVEADASFGDNVDYLASVRARLGYAIDNLLIYATAGVAFAGFDDKEVDLLFRDRVVHTFDVSGDSEVGAVVGAGVEYKLAANWSVGVEGLYYFFGDSNDSLTKGNDCFEMKFSHDDDNDMFVVRGRLSYHFTDDRYDAPLK